MPIFPRMSYDPKRDIFIWRTGREDDKLGVFVAWYSLESVDWGFGFIAASQQRGKDNVGEGNQDGSRRGRT